MRSKSTVDNKRTFTQPIKKQRHRPKKHSQQHLINFSSSHSFSLQNQWSQAVTPFSLSRNCRVSDERIQCYLLLVECNGRRPCCCFFACGANVNAVKIQGFFLGGILDLLVDLVFLEILTLIGLTSSFLPLFKLPPPPGFTKWRRLFTCQSLLLRYLFC